MTDLQAEIWLNLNSQDIHVGTVFDHRSGATESSSFNYTSGYLAAKDAYPIDPALPLASGAFHTSVGRKLFGALTDSAPDRWGRRLTERSERITARAEGRTKRSFGELDFALNVRDDIRQGALRYRSLGSDAWLSPEATAVPHLIKLGSLLDSVGRVEGDDPDSEALRLLLRAGSSIGGARPKAALLNSRGELVIAKFPRVGSDEWDVMAWEKLTLDLAALAGINVPRTELVAINGHNVLLLNRFDRDDQIRIGYVSAMTMLEALDGDQGTYLAIADVIDRESPTPSKDLRELWIRAVFGFLVSNTDDHLRNHGFLRTGPGWALSPAFDINPNPESSDHSTSLDGATEYSEKGLLDLAPHFRIKDDDALQLMAKIKLAVSSWADAATRLGIPAAEIDLMRDAFERL